MSISNRSSYIEYYESESSSNDQAASLNESDYEHFEFDEASSYDDYSFRTDTSVYNESFHTANNSSYSDDDFSSISSEGYSSPVEDSNEPSQGNSIFYRIMFVLTFFTISQFLEKTKHL